MVCYGIFWSGQLRVIEGPNAHDKIAFSAFHSFLVEVQTNAGYIHAKINHQKSHAEFPSPKIFQKH